MILASGGYFHSSTQTHSVPHEGQDSAQLEERHSQTFNHYIYFTAVTLIHFYFEYER